MLRLLDALIVGWLLGCILLASGCGVDTTRQTQIAEKVTTVTGPVVAEIPMLGAVTVQPIKQEVVRTQEEASTQRTSLHAPEIGAIMTPALSAIPGVGMAGGLLGLLTTAAAGWKALQFRRQRDEMISGVEKAKGAMDEATWDRVKDKLAAVQSTDTQRVIYEKTP